MGVAESKQSKADVCQGLYAVCSIRCGVGVLVWWKKQVRAKLCVLGHGGWCRGDEIKRILTFVDAEENKKRKKKKKKNRATSTNKKRSRSRKTLEKKSTDVEKEAAMIVCERETSEKLWNRHRLTLIIGAETSRGRQFLRNKKKTITTIANRGPYTKSFNLSVFIDDRDTDREHACNISSGMHGFLSNHRIHDPEILGQPRRVCFGFSKDRECFESFKTHLDAITKLSRVTRAKEFREYRPWVFFFFFQFFFPSPQSFIRRFQGSILSHRPSLQIHSFLSLCDLCLHSREKRDFFRVSVYLRSKLFFWLVFRSNSFLSLRNDARSKHRYVLVVSRSYVTFCGINC